MGIRIPPSIINIKINGAIGVIFSHKNPPRIAAGTEPGGRMGVELLPNIGFVCWRSLIPVVLHLYREPRKISHGREKGNLLVKVDAANFKGSQFIEPVPLPTKVFSMVEEKEVNQE